MRVRLLDSNGAIILETRVPTFIAGAPNVVSWRGTVYVRLETTIVAGDGIATYSYQETQSLALADGATSDPTPPVQKPTDPPAVAGENK